MREKSASALFWLGFLWLILVVGWTSYLNIEWLSDGRYSVLAPIMIGLYGAPSALLVIVSQLLQFEWKRVLLYFAFIALIVVALIYLDVDHSGFG